MSELDLHPHLAKLPEDALKELAEWCMLDQAKEGGYEFTPDSIKLKKFTGGHYVEQLVDQFMNATRNTIEGGMAAFAAGKEADNHDLKGLPIVVDFISLYVKYLLPKGKKSTLSTDEKLAQASQQQFDKLNQIAAKYNVVL
ncbi:hypothetical protein [Calothrix sp. PCC 6303]|uniref:hypothetical protein n=1 Tax=Calothrix sp. PCC 6303 TaxID=1170562 RepID=UPI0002A0553A|nr:hypothetical protein [Calothrix sp. PCC 6303]AFY99319.1 hypothetical protein Cal6303_0213 [Calothrix sp. PCC 6303]